MFIQILEMVIPVCPSILWFFLIVAIILFFRGTLRELVSSLIWRVKSGAGIKIASFELGASYVSPGKSISAETKLIDVKVDEDRERCEERGKYYIPNRDLFLVHQVAPSTKPRQMYDILIYLIPHKEATLVSVQKVEYYFGRHWGDRIFINTNRSTGFSISTSAYGPFVCTAKVYFTDGQTTMIWRYIDFEMGSIGKGID